MKALVFASAMGLAILVVTAAPAAHLPSRITVKVKVQADGALKSIVEADLANELQKLSGVLVTDDENADWLLYISVVPLTNAQGIQGYIFSTVIADQYAARTLRALPREDFASPAAAGMVRNLLKNQVDLRDHLVQIYPSKGLSKAYSTIVNYFDQTYLMPAQEEIDNYNRDR